MLSSGSKFKFAKGEFAKAKDFDNKNAKDSKLRAAYALTIPLVEAAYPGAKELQSRIKEYAEAYDVKLE